MQRREFITLLSGAAVAWPLAARAQQPDRVRRIGVLMGFAEDDPETKARLTAFRQRLEKRGWSEGRNVHIETRFAPASSNHEAARERAGRAQPDVILAHTTPVAAALQRESRAIPIVFVSVSDPDWFRLRRELGAAGRKFHRRAAIRGGRRWQVAGDAQGNRAAS